MNKADLKELQGRYAAKRMFPGRTYEFTEPYAPYDALSTGKTICVEEYKAYNDPEHPRYHNRTGSGHPIDDYQIDYNKCREIVKTAKNSKEGPRQPILEVFFTDCVCVWDLDKTGWESTATWTKVNKKGINYGEKEWELQAFLKFDTSEGLIYQKDIPEGFWEEVNKDIENDYPGLKKERLK